MGRNKRTKNRRAHAQNLTTPINVSCDPSLINLIKWMMCNSWKPTCNLQPAMFSYTGRGMMAKETIKVNEVLISIPEHLLITTKTVLMSSVAVLFQNVTDTNFPTAQQILSTFVALEYKKGSSSEWYKYIATIPRTFSTPLFCEKQEVIPKYVKKCVDTTQETIRSSYNFVASQGTLHGFQDLSWEDFLWAWYAVNSRAVYFEVHENCGTVRDRNCLALAPYLDLLNHSADIPVNQVNLHNGHYQLRSSACFKKYDQVFISYGAHDNLTLCLEYGFILPNNPHDCVPLSREEIEIACGGHTCHPKIEAQGEFFCTREGLSWNTLHYVSKCLSVDNFDLNSNEKVRDAAQKILSNKIEAMKKDLNLVTIENASESYTILKSLLEEHISLLLYASAEYLK